MSYAFKVGTTLNDRYLIEDTLGLGGMSTVYLGHDPRLDRKVAIKAIHPFLINHDSFLDRFKIEASAIARLRHNHIVQVFDYDQHDGIHYIALEYVSGGNLKEALERAREEESYIPVENILTIMIALSDAVAYAHDLKMLHRDLKPDNVLLRPSKEPVLTDFGIVKMLAGGKQTQTGSLLGTIAYMSPEQVEGKGVDHRSDLYALGVILYELSTGRRPFSGDSPLQMMMMHATESAPPFEQFVEDDRAREIKLLEPIVDKLLAKSPDDRYQNARTLIEDLQKLLGAQETGTVIMPVLPGLEQLQEPQNGTTSKGQATTFTGLFDVQLTESFSPETAYHEGLLEIETLEQRVRQDPLREDLVRELMALNGRSGKFIEALQKFAQFQERFTTQLGIDVHPDTELLRARILAARLAPLHNLRPDMTPFVGREREIGILWRNLVRPSVRLMTVIGAGGMGKTRIAREFIRQVAGAKWRYFLHGCTLVSLDPLETDARESNIVHAIAQALNIQLDRAETPLEQLLVFLQNREVLLVLDNFEHLIERAPLIRTILDQTRHVKILVTSRQRLNIPEEEVLPIEGFSTVHIDPHQLETGAILSDGMRLFVQTAVKNRPQFRPRRNDLESILEICSLLDGMPLGIELAASWVRVYSCEEIESRLRDNLDFLAVNHQYLPPRHRSLQAAYDYSWKLLHPEEQATIKALSVIQGRFDIHAALEISRSSPEILTELTDKSLLQMIYLTDETATQSIQAYLLHPVIRHFSNFLLSQEPNGYQQAVLAHRLYYVKQLLEVQHGLLGPPQLLAINQVEFNYENIVLAWRNSLMLPNYEDLTVDDLVLATKVLTNYYLLYGLFQQGVETFSTAFDILPGATPTEIKTTIALSICDLLTQISDNERVLPILQPIIADFESKERLEHWEIEALAYAQSIQATVWSDMGRWEDADREAKRALARYQELGLLYKSAHVLRYLGRTYWSSGRFGEAYDFYEQAKEIYRDYKDHYYISIIEGTQALPLVLGGQADRAIEILKSDLKMMSEWRNRKRMATDHLNLAWAYTFQGKLEEADQDIEASQIHYRECGDFDGLASSFLIKGRINLVRGTHAVARSHFQQGLRIAKDINVPPKMMEGIAGIAMTILEIEKDTRFAYKICSFVYDKVSMGSLGSFYVFDIEKVAKKELSKEERDGIIKSGSELELESVVDLMLSLKLR